MSYDEVVAHATRNLPAPPSLQRARRLARDLAVIAPERRHLLLVNSLRFAAEPLLPCALANLAYEQRHRDSPELLALAESAVAALRVVRWPPSLPSIVRSDLEAEVLAHHANALRVVGRLAQCGVRLHEARLLARKGSGDPCLAALISSFEGSLAYMKSRFLDAAQHYRRAARHYRSVGHRCGSELIAAGRAYKAEGCHQDAISYLKAGLRRIDVGSESEMALCAAQNLASAEALDGRPAEALEIIAGLGALREDHADTLLELRIRWLEGRCLTELGRFTQAADVLSYVADEFLARGCERDAAIVHLDLIAALSGLGKKTEIRSILKRLAPILAVYEAPAEALAALRLQETTG